MRPMAGSGANPMVPKNGRSIGTTTPFATSAVLVSRLSGMNDLRPDPREFLRQGAGISPLAIVPPIEGEIDIEDADFEHMARHRALDFNRAGQDMRARAAILHLAVDVAVVLRNGAGRNHAGLVNNRWDDGGDALQRDDVP